MSTYNIVYETYDVVRLIEGAVFAGLKEPDPLPTAQANECCLFYRKSFICSLATSKTVSETRSGGVPAPLNMAVVEVHRHCLLTSQLCRPPLGLSESLSVPILVLQYSFQCHPRGWRRG